MKNSKKILLALLLIGAMVSALNTSADDTDTTSDSEVTTKEARMAKMKEAKEAYKEGKGEMKKENKELRTEHKENRKNFMEEEGKAKEAFADLPEEVKTQLKTLGEQRETDLKVVKEKMEDEALTQEEKDNLREEYRAINDEYHNKVKENLADYPDALAYVEAKGELKDKNRVLRDDIRGNRREFKEEKKELISKYRYTYFDQLQVILPKVKTEKLEQISEKIDSMIEKLENNTSMNEDTKDKLMAQYISIQEIIEEELTTRDEDEESIDLDAILDEVSE